MIILDLLLVVLIVAVIGFVVYYGTWLIGIILGFILKYFFVGVVIIAIFMTLVEFLFG